MPSTTKRILLYAFLILNGISLAAQANATIAISLSRVAGVGPFYKNSKFIRTKKIDANYTGMPKDLEQSAFFEISLHPNQDIFDRSKKSLSLNEYEQAHLTANIDTNQLAKEEIDHTVSIFVGLNKQNKFIIFDANQNDDFSDDHVFEFDLSHFSKGDEYWEIHSPTILLNYERFNPKTNNNIKRDVVAKIYPFNNNDDHDKLPFSLLSDEHRLGTFTTEQKKYNIALAILSPFSDDFSNVEIAFSPFGKKFNRTEEKAKIGSYIRLGEQDFLVERITPIGDTLFLKPTEQVPNQTNHTSKTIAPFAMEDLTGTLINTQDYKDQYLLLNFWGTWCGPCVKKVPYLNQIYETASTKNLEIIGIVKDQNQEIVKEFLTAHRIKWKNIFEDFVDLSETRLTELFQISSYPVMILYLPNGEGVIRAETLEEVEKLQLYLDKL